MNLRFKTEISGLTSNLFNPIYVCFSQKKKILQGVMCLVLFKMMHDPFSSQQRTYNINMYITKSPSSKQGLYFNIR